MSAKSRRKGHNFERRIANELCVAGYEAKRNLNETRDGNSGDIEINACLTFQLKNYDKVAPWRQALREAEDVARPRNHYAIAVTKVNNSEPVAHIPWHDLLEILALPDVRAALQEGPKW